MNNLKPIQANIMKSLNVVIRTPLGGRSLYIVVPLHAQGYIRHEFLIDGFAEGEIHRTRLILHFPEDPTRFSGLVVVEPFDLWGGLQVWPKVKRWIMRSPKSISRWKYCLLLSSDNFTGHAWIQMDSQAPGAMELQHSDKRYKDIRFIPTSTFKQTSDCIPQTLNVPEPASG
ncbi:hypothetical protein N7508_010305 [Penicillium antarcticum]|uniref:uncharacterized protein n=1 Tax=Penicillium antarcticum TaxID=416450 RepID=UPI002388EB5C|nr:uncharacterized protein N7508_010305 [Penicillium antarcticum]KAJ5295484.1 hypothetical protein N7508_010305 [Penicillium antarcticum]